MSTDTQPQWKLDNLGQFGEPREFEVTKERTIAYAHAQGVVHRGTRITAPVRTQPGTQRVVVSRDHRGGDHVGLQGPVARLDN